MIKKVLIPSDTTLFKQKLLKTKQAKRILLYKDGSAKVEMWNADKFTSSSDLMGNIDSQLWHRKDRDEIIEAIYEIDEADNPNFNNQYDSVGNNCKSDVYIHYKKGWSSFRPVEEHMVEYIIENGELTIFYNIGFGPGKTTTRKISDKDMGELLDIMNAAVIKDVFENSSTAVRAEHGIMWGYDYEYGDQIGRECAALFTDDKLNTRYGILIEKLTK